MLKNKYLPIAIGLLAGCMLVASGAALAQKLSRAAPFPEASEELYGIGAGGKLYVFGGLAPGWKPKGLVYEYDPASNTWEAKQTMPTARNHAAAGFVSGKIYVIGGRVGAAFITRASNTDIVEVYDVATDQWGDLKAPMPTPRSAAAWGVHKGLIYVAGGEQRTSQFQRTFRAVEAYNPANNRWLQLPPMEFPRHGLAGDIVNGKFHLVSGDAASGGAPGTHIDSDVHEVIDLEAR